MNGVFVFLRFIMIRIGISIGFLSVFLGLETLMAVLTDLEAIGIPVSSTGPIPANLISFDCPVSEEGGTLLGECSTGLRPLLVGDRLLLGGPAPGAPPVCRGHTLAGPDPFTCQPVERRASIVQFLKETFKMF